MLVYYCELKYCLTGVFALLAIPVASSAAASGLATLPSATNVLNRVIERASHVARAGKDEKYSYAKRTLTQELNSQGKIIQSTEKSKFKDNSCPRRKSEKRMKENRISTKSSKAVM